MLNAHLSAEGTGRKQSRSVGGKKRYFLTYSQVASFLLKMHATDTFIVETESDIRRFAQTSHVTLSQYAEGLVTKILWCEDFYEKQDLDEISFEGRDDLIRLSMRGCRGN